MKAALFAIACVLAIALAAVPGASGRARRASVSVHVRGRPDVRRSVHIGFRAGALPAGGYYYAVLVLEPYRHYTRASPPPCSTSSDMQRTDYGYPRADGSVTLALTPAAAPARHWCRGGTYAGAVYAVPHAPPCERAYPCRSEPYEPPSPCWEVAQGRRVCGVVIQPKRYAYPGGIPAPLAAGTRIVARFAVAFR